VNDARGGHLEPMAKIVDSSVHELLQTEKTTVVAGFRQGSAVEQTK